MYNTNDCQVEENIYQHKLLYIQEFRSFYLIYKGCQLEILTTGILLCGLYCYTSLYFDFGHGDIEIK